VNSPCEPFDEFFESDAIFERESCDAIRVNVEYGKQLVVSTEDRHHDFGTRPRITSDVAWKSHDVLHNLRHSSSRGSATNPAPKLYFKTPESSLIRADTQQATWLHNSVEASPEMAKSMVNQRAHRSHGCDFIIDSFKHSGNLHIELFISLSYRYSAQINYRFSH